MAKASNSKSKSTKKAPSAKAQVKAYQKEVTDFTGKQKRFREELAADKKALKKSFQKWGKTMKAPMFLEQLDDQTRADLKKNHATANRLTK